MNRRIAPKKIKGRKLNNTPNSDESPLCPLGMISTFDVARSTPPRWRISTIDDPLSLRDARVSPDVVRIVRLSPFTSMEAMLPLAVIATTSFIPISWSPPTAPESRFTTIATIATVISR